MLYSVLKLHIKGTLSYSNNVKNKMKHKISDHFQYCLRFMFIPELATIIFILFS